MNKRDFLVHGGGVLLSGATMGAAWAARTPANTTPYDTATPATPQPKTTTKSKSSTILMAVAMPT